MGQGWPNLGADVGFSHGSVDLGFGNGGGWWRSVAWSTCFLVWKNMKCCRSNIEVSISYVVVLSARHFVCAIELHPQTQTGGC